MQSVNTSSVHTKPAQSSSTSMAFSTTLQIVGALMLGLGMLYVVGFAEMSAAHNAAHDSRHSFAFPCH